MTTRRCARGFEKQPNSPRSLQVAADYAARHRPPRGVVIRLLIMRGLMLGLALAATAQGARAAEPPSPQAACAASFSARLADARKALQLQAAFARDTARVMPWFEAHCRLLSPLEIALRKLDDPNSFVCEPAAGRPSGMTPRFVLEHSYEHNASEFQMRVAPECAPYDPVALDLRGLPPAVDATRAEKLRGLAATVGVQCYQKSTPACVKARKTLAELQQLVADGGAS